MSLTLSIMPLCCFVGTAEVVHSRIVTDSQWPLSHLRASKLSQELVHFPWHGISHVGDFAGQGKLQPKHLH